MPLRVAAITPKMKNGHNIVNLSPRTANEVLNYGFLGWSNMIELSWVMVGIIRVAAITPKMKNGHNIVSLSPRTANELNYGFLGSSNMIEPSWVMVINPLMLYDAPSQCMRKPSATSDKPTYKSNWLTSKHAIVSHNVRRLCIFNLYYVNKLFTPAR